MSILILMSKIILVKYLAPVRHKFVPKLKVPRLYLNLVIWYFEYADLDFKVKNNFCEIFTTR